MATYGPGQPLPYNFAFSGGAPASALAWGGQDSTGNPFRGGTQEHEEYRNLYTRRGPEIAPGVGAQDSRAAMNDLLAGQEAKQADFIKRYTEKISGLPTTQSLWQQGQTATGFDIPTLAATSNTYQQAVKQIPGTETATTRAFNVSSNQLKGRIAQKLSDVSPKAQEALNALQFGTGQVGDWVQRGQADISRELLPYQTEASMISDAASRAVTGYTSAMQSDLGVLLEKMKEGYQATQAELDRANELAVKEREYTNTQKMFDYAKSQGYTPPGYTSTTSSTKAADKFLEVGDSLYNTETGQWVSAPKSASSSSGGFSPTVSSNPYGLG